RRRERAVFLRHCDPYAERRPDGWVPGGRQGAPPPALLAARRGLLLCHLAGLAALPLALALLLTGALPAAAFGGTPVAAASGKWRHPAAASRALLSDSDGPDETGRLSDLDHVSLAACLNCVPIASCCAGGGSPTSNRGRL
ncbi:MAG: hypothetical protein QOI83_2905, partial [Streptomycetaceae bacterium]|nr:hypothetical protein [Streptomycetaceae bacterium]